MIWHPEWPSNGPNAATQKDREVNSSLMKNFEQQKMRVGCNMQAATLLLFTPTTTQWYGFFLKPVWRYPLCWADTPDKQCTESLHGLVWSKSSAVTHYVSLLHITLLPLFPHPLQPPSSLCPNFVSFKSGTSTIILASGSVF